MAKDKRDNEEYLVIAEVRALRYIMQFPEHRHEFRPSMFIHKTARLLYESIHELVGEGQSLSPSSIAQVVNKKDSKLTLPSVKDLLFTGEQETFVEVDHKLLLKDLESSEVRARIHKELEKAVSRITEPSVPDEQFFDEVGKHLVAAQTEALNRSGSPLITLKKGYERYEEDLAERERGNLPNSGDMLLDSALVRRTAGGQMITLAGATGSGKSLYILNLMNGFIELDIPAIYITLEMDMISTLDRLSALRTRTPISDWYEADKIVNLRRKLKEDTDYLNGKDLRFEIVEDPSLSLADVNAIIGEFRSKYQIPLNQRVVVGIDLVTMLKDYTSGSNKGYSMAGNYEVAANVQNAIAKLQNVCFINTVQYNRDADNVPIETFQDLQRTRPSLNNIKNGAAIGERSRVVLSIWRPYYYATRYLPDLEETRNMEDIMYVQVLKQNQGDVGMQLAYRFNGSHGEVLPTRDENLNAELGITSEEAGLLDDVGF